MTTVDVAIIAAVWTEAKPIVRRLGLRDDDRTFAQAYCWSGDFAGRSVLLITTGMGRRRATEAVGDLLDRVKPGCVIITGLCGGLDPALKIADLVKPDEVIEAGTSRPHRRSAPLHGAVGRMVTIDHVIDTPQAKARLREQHEALAVDMETAVVAAICDAAHIPWACVRAVGDTASQTLPAWLGRCVDSEGYARPMMTLGQLLLHPLDLLRLIRTGRNATVASRAIAEALAGIVDKSAD